MVLNGYYVHYLNPYPGIYMVLKEYQYQEYQQAQLHLMFKLKHFSFFVEVMNMLW